MCLKAYTHLRYFLGGDRPSQTTNQKLKVLILITKLSYTI